MNAKDYLFYTKKIAAKFYHCHKPEIEFDDIIGEANLILCKCIDNYDPASPVHFSLYLHKNIILGLKTFAHKNYNFEISYVPLEKIPSHVYEYNDFFVDAIIFENVINNLSDDARYCVDLIFNNPFEMMQYSIRQDDTCWAQKLNKTIIQKYLRLEQGWSFPRIQNTFAEIKAAL